MINQEEFFIFGRIVYGGKKDIILYIIRKEFQFMFICLGLMIFRVV